MAAQRQGELRSLLFDRSGFSCRGGASLSGDMWTASSGDAPLSWSPGSCRSAWTSPPDGNRWRCCPNPRRKRTPFSWLGDMLTFRTAAAARHKPSRIPHVASPRTWPTWRSGAAFSVAVVAPWQDIWKVQLLSNGPKITERRDSGVCQSVTTV